MVAINILMVQDMKETGEKISNMALEKKSGLTMPAMKESIVTERNMVKASSYGVMSLNMKANLLKTILKAMVVIFGQMVESMKERG